jgi:hypothetical protein
MMGRGEKDRIRGPAKVMAEYVKRTDRVTEVACHLFRRTVLDKIGPEGFVNTLFGAPGIEEEGATLT